jgi:hypothetical protein
MVDTTGRPVFDKFDIAQLARQFEFVRSHRSLDGKDVLFEPLEQIRIVSEATSRYLHGVDVRLDESRCDDIELTMVVGWILFSELCFLTDPFDSRSVYDYTAIFDV